MVESNISTMFGCVKAQESIAYSREYWLFDLTLAERKRRIGYPYRTVVVESQCHSSAGGAPRFP